jgi:hypothetical protein
MRFVAAACAALLMLVCDFDSSTPQPTPTGVTAVESPQRPLLVPVVEWFLTSVEALDLANARADLAEPIVPAGPAPVEETPALTTEQFCHALRAAAEQSGIPLPFFARLIWQESRFRSDEVSHAGAQGVAQFMPDTAADVGLDDPFDPIKALPASARFLRKLRDDFGNLGLAAAAYNAGPGRIQKWLAKEGELPQETRDYVRIITGTRAEDWTARSAALAIRIDLPRGAPCEGIGSLSKARDVALVPVNLTATVSGMIRKGELAAHRARLRLAASLRSRNSTNARARGMIETRAAKGPKSRAIRLASQE